MARSPHDAWKPVEPRLNRVFDHIEDHIADPIDLDGLAGLAAYSRFHFIRVFDACFGETPYEFIRRRRIGLVASRLRFSVHEPVSSIAMSCGFASQETMARAFRHAYGMSATDWRHGGWRGAQLLVPPTPSFGDVGSVAVNHRSERRLFYLRVRGPYEEAVPAAWVHFSRWVRGLGLQPLAWYGMGLDDPGLTPPAQRRYDVCVELAQPLPDAFRWGLREPQAKTGSWKRFVGGLYAAMSCPSSAGSSDAAWQYLLGDWLPGSGYALGHGNFCELFPADARFDGTPPRRELLLPVRLLRTS